jgi:hypothetical protein
MKDYPKERSIAQAFLELADLRAEIAGGAHDSANYPNETQERDISRLRGALEALIGTIQLNVAPIPPVLQREIDIAESTMRLTKYKRADISTPQPPPSGSE